jgi:putative restriction endonuclease
MLRPRKNAPSNTSMPISLAHRWDCLTAPTPSESTHEHDRVLWLRKDHSFLPWACFAVMLSALSTKLPKNEKTGLTAGYPMTALGRVSANEKARRWTFDELIVAFNVYCRTPYGQLHHRNPLIVALARKLGRTPSAVAMKLVNFASMDPAQQSRDVAGLKHASKLDADVWNAFHSDWEKLAIESEGALARLGLRPVENAGTALPELPAGETESTRLRRVRLVQRFFRETVLSNYESHCALCGLSIPALLLASHIIPWSKSVERRADPRNGLALCGIHDRAFDCGYLTLDENLRVMVAKAARTESPSKLHTVALLEIEGERMARPLRFHPDPFALAYHRKSIFLH